MKTNTLIKKINHSQPTQDEVDEACRDMLLDLEVAGMAEYEACQKLAAAGWRKVAPAMPLKKTRARDSKGRFI